MLLLLWGGVIFYPKASKTQLHICHESPVYLQIFLCFPIYQPRNSLWLLSLGAKACHETGSTVTGLLLDTVTEVTGSSLLYFPHMLPHSPAGPECVWTDPHPCPSDSVRQRERRPHTRTQGLQNPCLRGFTKGHTGPRRPHGFQAHPTSSTSQGRGVKQKGHGLGPATATVFIRREVHGQEKASKVG